MYQLAGADEYRFPGAEAPYVLEVIPVASGLATISSDGKLALFDPQQISAGPKRSYNTPHDNLTAAREFDVASSVVATAGSNGSVALWDLRDSAQGPQVNIAVGSSDAGILSLACNSQTQSVAAGTELVNYKASILIWDVRAGKAPRVQYSEIHSDDVTELNFHPSNVHVLLTGSTDGLVNVCDTRVADEDEVVLEAFNHGHSIHHAGFLNDAEVYAVSHDEKLALYDATKEQEASSATRDFGDVRPVLDCQYVANVLPKAGQAGAVLGVGSQDAQMFRLIHLVKDVSQVWGFALDSVVGLPGAHGGEIVRGFCVYDEQQVAYTCGEDGSLRAWRPPA